LSITEVTDKNRFDGANGSPCAAIICAQQPNNVSQESLNPATRPNYELDKVAMLMAFQAICGNIGDSQVQE
jgi:hypothetical protein